MHLLYAAPTSKVKYDGPDEKRAQLVKESTGTMETDLITMWSGHERCINRKGGGGDCPSNGSPHFVYIALR